MLNLERTLYWKVWETEQTIIFSNEAPIIIKKNTNYSSLAI